MNATIHGKKLGVARFLAFYSYDDAEPLTARCDETLQFLVNVNE